MGLSRCLSVFLSLCLSLMLGLPAHAGAPQVKPESREFALGPHLQALADPSGQRTATEVLALPDSAWQSLPKGANQGYTATAYWYRVAVLNPSATQTMSRVLEVSYPQLDYLDLYLVEADGPRKVMATGDKRPFAQRPVQHRNFVYPLEVPPQATAHLLFRIQTAGAHKVPMTLWAQEEFLESTITETLLRAIAYGGQLFLITVSLCVWLVIRLRLYVYYVAAMGAYLAVLAGLDGVGYQYLYPSLPRLHELVILVSVPLMLSAATLFTRTFLSVSALTPRWSRALLLTAQATGGLTALAFVLPYGLSTRLSVFSVAPVCVLLISAAVSCLRRNDRAVQFFTAAWVCLLGGVIWFVLSTIGVIPPSRLTDNSVVIGAGLQGLLLSVALAVRINNDRREKIEAQRQRLEAMAQQQKAEADLFQATIDRRVSEEVIVARAEMAESSALAQAQQHQRVRLLLDHIRQGVFSVDAQGVVQGEFSRASVAMLGCEPAGLPVGALLFPHDDTQRQQMHDLLADAVGERDARRRALYLSLLPRQLALGDKHLQLDYIPLDEGVLFAVSDVSDPVALQERVHRERRRLEMIVAAVTDSDAFFSSVDAIQEFAAAGPTPWQGQSVAPLYRAVHTFKGNLDQLGFYHLPAALHRAEDHLRGHDPSDDAGSLLDAVFAENWQQTLQADLEPLTAALGQGFISGRGVVTLQSGQAFWVETLARFYLQHHPDAPPEAQHLARIRHIALNRELAAHDAMLQRVAANLGKQVLPLEITGDEVWLDPDRHRELLQSLVHLLRNAIDHGIEDPDARLAAGKPEAGRIQCHLQQEPDRWVLTLRDDGAGINEAALRLRALDLPHIDAQHASLEALVFADGLSSRQEVTPLSGRGMGMSAVKAAVQALGGQIFVQTEAGRWTQVRVEMSVA
jgi:two-component sensor histidine kinase/PAS domain-containing protein